MKQAHFSVSYLRPVCVECPDLVVVDDIIATSKSRFAASHWMLVELASDEVDKRIFSRRLDDIDPSACGNEYLVLL